MSRPQWLGFRIAAEGIGRDCLMRFLRLLGDSLESRRWFYLWHADGGLHVRLRIRSRNERDAAEIGAAVRRCASCLGRSPSMGNEPYCRPVHGFGETKESVLAELLHVATSKLALQIVSNVQPPSDGRLWLVAACSVWMLINRGIPSSDLARFLQESLDFASRVARVDSAFGGVTHDDQRVHAVRCCVSRLDAQLRDNRLLRRACGIVARLWRRGSSGRFVALHGIHLFCNELGMSIQREYVILRVLAELHRNHTAGSA